MRRLPATVGLPSATFGSSVPAHRPRYPRTCSSAQRSADTGHCAQQPLSPRSSLQSVFSQASFPPLFPCAGRILLCWIQHYPAGRGEVRQCRQHYPGALNHRQSHMLASEAGTRGPLWNQCIVHRWPVITLHQPSAPPADQVCSGLTTQQPREAPQNSMYQHHPLPVKRTLLKAAFTSHWTSQALFSDR